MPTNRPRGPLLGIVLGIVLAIGLSGCAPAYHAYSGACTAYGYCPEPPLPYATYDNCHCRAPVAGEISGPRH